MLSVSKHFQDFVLLSARIGDGCYIKNSCGERFGKITYYLQLSSSDLEYLNFKRQHLLNIGVYCRSCKIGKSGYGKSLINYFETRIHPLISEIGNMSKLEVINSLNLPALILYYLDDGSFHQKKKFGHIYCNSFSLEEVNALILRIKSFYPKCKSPTLRFDRKKDGREFPYLYIPVDMMKVFSEDVKSFIMWNNLYSMLYKVGEKFEISYKEG